MIAGALSQSESVRVAVNEDGELLIAHDSPRLATATQWTLEVGNGRLVANMPAPEGNLEACPISSRSISRIKPGRVRVVFMDDRGRPRETLARLLVQN